MTKKIRSRYSVFLLMTIVCIILVYKEDTYAHSLKVWAENYTQSNAGGDHQFAINHCMHIDGNTVSYYWENSDVRNKFVSPLKNAVGYWDNLIKAKEVDKSEAHIVIRHNPNDTIENRAAYVPTYNREGHISPTGQRTEIVITKGYDYNETEKSQIMAHELGHLWGIDDLYTVKKTNLDSMYSRPYGFLKATRHDKNAMRIGLNNFWFENANGGMMYQKSPGVWANNEWLTINGTEYYFKGNTKYTAYKIKYNANGGSGAPDFQTKLFNENLILSNQKPTKNYVIKYNSNNGTITQNSKTVTATFKNWNTNISGTGTNYSPGSTYSKNMATSLYAQWTNPTAGTFPTVSKPNYIFDGWYTKSSGGTKVNEKTVVTGNVTYYAHWKGSELLTLDKATDAIATKGGNYDYFRFIPQTNGAYKFESSGDKDTFATLYADNDLRYELASDDDSGDGKNFSIIYWLKAGKTYYFSTKFYNGSETGKFPIKITKYSGTTYNVYYNSNASGVTNVPDKDVKIATTALTLPEEEPVRNNYVFLGWDTNKTATNPTYYKDNYKFNKKYSTNQAVNMYAIWGLRGDVDRDDKVSLSDAQLALKIALNSVTPTVFQKKLMDYNNDGQINMTDVQLIQKKALGII